MTEQDLDYPGRVFVPKPFFVPAAGEGSDLSIWASLASNAVGGVTDRKVQRLEYMHNGKPMISEVGHLEHDGTAEWLVLAIFETVSGPWNISIVRPVDGTWKTREVPILVSPGDVTHVFDFAPTEQVTKQDP